MDDTGFPKQGKHSVGVVRQYCGRLGKQDNCRVAVMLSLANHHASLPVAYRLYLPMRRDAKHQPISVKELSLNLPASTWRKVTWINLRSRPH